MARYLKPVFMAIRTGFLVLKIVKLNLRAYDSYRLLAKDRTSYNGGVADRDKSQLRIAVSSAGYISPITNSTGDAAVRDASYLTVVEHA